MAASTRTYSFVEFTGAAKLDRRTKNLVRRLGPGDVAVIDHTDLDRVSAEGLLGSGVRGVVNGAAARVFLGAAPASPRGACCRPTSSRVRSPSSAGASPRRSRHSPTTRFD